MEFQITEAEVQRLAQLETEAGGMISAGPNLGDRLGDVMCVELFGVDHRKVVELLQAEYGNLLSYAEVEEVAADLQTQIESRLMRKSVLPNSALWNNIVPQC
jgi:hypothetical protein